MTAFDYFNGMTYFGGSVRFENMVPAKPDQQLKWNRNRARAYYGSLKHLLVSLVSGKAAESGFKMFTVRDSLRKPKIQFGSPKKPGITDPEANTIEISPESIATAIGQTHDWRIHSKPVLEIFYTRKRGQSPYKDMPYQYSLMSLPQQFMVVTDQGWVSEPRGMTVEGYLSNDRLGTLLPADWRPE